MSLGSPRAVVWKYNRTTVSYTVISTYKTQVTSTSTDLHVDEHTPLFAFSFSKSFDVSSCAALSTLIDLLSSE